MVWDLIFGACWVPWGAFWEFGRVLGTGWNLGDWLAGHRDPQDLRKYGQVVVNCHSPRYS